MDTADYLDSPAGVTVDLRPDQMAGAICRTVTTDRPYRPPEDYLYSIENVNGSGYDDMLRGNDVANVLIGFDGNDYLSGNGGNDQLYGLQGDD